MGNVAPDADGLLRWTGTEVQERRAAYGEAGRAPVLVFVHGCAVTNRTYKAALKRLLAARGMHVIAPAVPGFDGTAPLPEGHGELEDFAQWLPAFLDAVVGDAPATLVGHSLGGGIGRGGRSPRLPSRSNRSARHLQ
ncbi:MAG: alpha/beta hydrolase [Actinobacteria bacterium]|nr:alpha/beta hydrolase [Actinomycetota bacterium]